jgi:hypothetical protein
LVVATGSAALVYLQRQGAGLVVAPTPRSAPWRHGNSGRDLSHAPWACSLGVGPCGMAPGSASWCCGSPKTTQRRNVVMSDVIHRSGSPPPGSTMHPCRSVSRPSQPGLAPRSTFRGDRESVWGSVNGPPVVDVIAWPIAPSSCFQPRPLHNRPLWPDPHGLTADCNRTFAPHRPDLQALAGPISFSLWLRAHRQFGPSHLPDRDSLPC